MVKINPQISNANPSRPVGQATARKGEEATAQTSESDSVSLKGNGEAASIARAASEKVSEVDEAKVAQLRAALARGEYRADLRLIAERVINEALQAGGSRG